MLSAINDKAVREQFSHQACQNLRELKVSQGFPSFARPPLHGLVVAVAILVLFLAVKVRDRQCTASVD